MPTSTGIGLQPLTNLTRKAALQLGTASCKRKEHAEDSGAPATRQSGVLGPAAPSAQAAQVKEQCPPPRVCGLHQTLRERPGVCALRRSSASGRTHPPSLARPLWEGKPGAEELCPGAEEGGCEREASASSGIRILYHWQRRNSPGRFY